MVELLFVRQLNMIIPLNMLHYLLRQVEHECIFVHHLSSEILADQRILVHSMQNFTDESMLILALLILQNTTFYYSNKCINKKTYYNNHGILFWIEEFWLKILGGIKIIAGCVAPMLHKVMGTLSGPVSMLHPGAGQIMGTIGNIAGGIDRHLNKG
ncbi:MAG: hypothetical protein EZS28_029387 [Streblomastix strix]|uniref:Uncharacterized protein n=1 Tax=Streblomastix strix TaxID=222440 RepID=A0A5J4UX86_9EUKA|nr:MAG: hypothetical protein EZS28_029387 [Streblomastix strix]